jgi:hypothetical protein
MTKQETQYELETESFINVNGFYMSRGVYNLLISIRDVKLYSKGIKPHRGWKIGDVKRYFGVKGNVLKVIEQLENLHEEHINNQN